MLASRPRLVQALTQTAQRLLYPPQTRMPSTHLRQLAGAPPGRAPPGRRATYARQHMERRIVPFSTRELYDVVADIDEYAQFVPWCTASRITDRIDDRHLIADLSVGFRLLSDKYSSVVTLDPLKRVSVDVPHSNLFEYLVTDWEFEKNPDPDTTTLGFHVEFAFRNPLYRRVTDLFFEEVVKQMVGAFEKRCHAKYRLADGRGGMLHRW